MSIKFGNYSLSFHRPDWAIRTPEQSAKRRQAPDPDVRQVSFLFFKGKRQFTPELRNRIAYQKELDAWVRKPPPSADFRGNKNIELSNRKNAQRAINRWIGSGEGGTLQLRAMGLSVLPPLPGKVIDVDFTDNRLVDWPALNQLPQTLRTLDLTGNSLDIHTLSQEYRAALPPGLTLIFAGERIGPEETGVRKDDTADLATGQGTQPTADAPGTPAASRTVDPMDGHTAATLPERLQQWIERAPESERNGRKQVAREISAWHERYAAGIASSSAGAKGKSAAYVPQPLTLENRGLTSCPPLPEGIEEASFRGNHFTSLPNMSDMPATLRSLDLTNNRIAQIISDHVASSNDRLYVHLGEISITREQNRLLQEASPGPMYAYTSISSAGETSNTDRNSRAMRGDVPLPEVITPPRPISVSSPTDDMSGGENISPRNGLWNALLLNDQAEIQRLLGAHPGILKEQNVNGRTPLHDAAMLGSIEGVTALTDMAKRLSEEDIQNLQSLDQEGKNPLHYAVRHAQHSAAFIPLMLPIMSEKAINMRDKEKNAPLDILVDRGDLAGLQELLKSSKVDVNNEDSEGNTALIKAVSKRHGRLVRRLTKDGRVLINFQNKLKNAAIHYAVMSSSDELVDFLLKHPRIDVNLAGENGMTPLHLAIEKSAFSIADGFIRHHNIDLNAGDSLGNTALHYAVMTNSLPFIRLLLQQYQIDLNVKNNEGLAPIHILAGGESFLSSSVVDELLLDSRVDLDLRNTEGKTAHNIASANGNTSFLNIYNEIHNGTRQRHPGPEGRSGAGGVPPRGSAFTGRIPKEVLTAMEVLGFTSGTIPNITDLTQAYKKLALQKHPDRHPNRRHEATVEFQRIANAYSVLGNHIQPGFDERGALDNT